MPQAETAASAGFGNAQRAALTVLLTDEERMALLRAEARRGLTAAPKELPPKWFYDQRGSALFESITRQPEYYLTRREHEILHARAEEIAARSRATTLVELGAGNAEKTRVLLSALQRAGTLRSYMPFDVCWPAVRDAATALRAEYPETVVHGVVGDFQQHVGLLPQEQASQSPAPSTRLVAFLGSTIGNFQADERRRFFRGLRRALRPGDGFLLGADLVKSKRRLDAAYNDAAGVTVEFNKNVLRVLNRDLGGSFDETLFDHLAEYDPERQLVDIRLRSRRRQVVSVRALELEVVFEAGEEMRTEVSAKFTPDGIRAALADAGFRANGFWTDDAGDFSLSLWTAG